MSDGQSRQDPPCQVEVRTVLGWWPWTKFDTVTEAEEWCLSQTKSTHHAFRVLVGGQEVSFIYTPSVLDDPAGKKA